MTFQNTQAQFYAHGWLVSLYVLHSSDEMFEFQKKKNLQLCLFNFAARVIFVFFVYIFSYKSAIKTNGLPLLFIASENSAKMSFGFFFLFLYKFRKNMNWNWMKIELALHTRYTADSCNHRYVLIFFVFEDSV